MYASTYQLNLLLESLDHQLHSCGTRTPSVGLNSFVGVSESRLKHINNYTHTQWHGMQIIMVTISVSFLVIHTFGGLGVAMITSYATFAQHTISQCRFDVQSISQEDVTSLLDIHWYQSLLWEVVHMLAMLQATPLEA